MEFYCMWWNSVCKSLSVWLTFVAVIIQENLQSGLGICCGNSLETGMWHWDPSRELLWLSSGTRNWIWVMGKGTGSGSAPEERPGWNWGGKSQRMVKKEKTKRNFWEILMGFVIPSSQSFLGQPDVSFPNTELSEISGFCFLEVF